VRDEWISKLLHDTRTKHGFWVSASSDILVDHLTGRFKRHNSVIYYIEVTVELILKVATPLIDGRIRIVEIKEDVELRDVQRVQAACKKGVWGRDCHTYYVNEAGWNHTMYPWSKPSPLSFIQS